MIIELKVGWMLLELLLGPPKDGGNNNFPNPIRRGETLRRLPKWEKWESILVLSPREYLLRRHAV